MIYMTNGVEMIPYTGKAHHASLRAAAKRMGTEWYPVSVTAASAPYAKDMLKAISSGATTLSKTQVEKAGLRKTNPRKRRATKPKNPANAKSVRLIARKGSAVKSRTRRANPSPQSTEKIFAVQQAQDLGYAGNWLNIGWSADEAKAVAYAKKVSKSYPDFSVRVMRMSYAEFRRNGEI